jgi:hypothetical protein
LSVTVTVPSTAVGVGCGLGLGCGELIQPGPLVAVPAVAVPALGWTLVGVGLATAGSEGEGFVPPPADGVGCGGLASYEGPAVFEASALNCPDPLPPHAAAVATTRATTASLMTV